MSQPSETFKKAPRRKTPQGKRVVVSAEAKKAYEAILREQDERAERERHLPPDMHRR